MAWLNWLGLTDMAWLAMGVFLGEGTAPEGVCVCVCVCVWGGGGGGLGGSSACCNLEHVSECKELSLPQEGAHEIAIQGLIASRLVGIGAGSTKVL